MFAAFWDDRSESNKGAAMKRRFVLVALMLALGLVVAGCTPTAARRITGAAANVLTNSIFYSVPQHIPAADPGTIYRIQRLQGAPNGAIAWRVLYHSRDLDNRDILVSGVVVAPTAAPPAGGRTIVAWGHPTTGAAQSCGPSSNIAPFDLIEGLTTLLKAGYVVAATDYPGMGVAGPDSYLIGISEGDSVLDSARVARHITAAHASSNLLLWGHSQGGQAALFAAQLAPKYAPELHLRGVAVAAPATDLGALLKDDIGTVSGVTIASYAFQSFSTVYAQTVPGTRLDTILTPAGARATPVMSKLCLVSGHTILHAIAGKLVGGYLAGDPATVQPWANLLQENTPGATALTVPLLVAQGDTDTLVHPSATDAFIAHECSIGTKVTALHIPATGHGGVALKAIPTVLSFFAHLPANSQASPAC
jgi:pimeloyl-ACP methyl ester carboxylesterase